MEYFSVIERNEVHSYMYKVYELQKHDAKWKKPVTK